MAAVKFCPVCLVEFRPRPRTSQTFCSKSCATRSRYLGQPKAVHRWGKRPPLDSAHRKLRAQLLPSALGAPCPLCGATLTKANAQLDHIVPRAQGGTSTRGRIVCKSCNLRRGAQLGGRVVHHRRHRPPATPASPDWGATWHSRNW